MRKILLDCDPGHDDAIAILLCGVCPEFDLCGITVVSGNQTLEKTARNAYNVSRYLGINVPVSLGASDPLVRKRLNCGEIHGESGLDGVDFPIYDYAYDGRKAPEFMRDLLLENEKMTVVTTGPMTNLATALTRYPGIKSHIEEIVSMGGSTKEGNISPYAEFNILADAEAAKIVFDSGIKMKMLGLDVTRKVLVLPSVIARMEKIDTKGARLFVDLMRFFNKTQKEVFGLEGGPLHDPVTLVSLLDPSCVKFENMDVEVDVSTSQFYGQTRCQKNADSHVQVGLGIDVEKYWDQIERALALAE